jgi:16S rRNA (uracil1498-N3)-methyltransferase
LVCERTEKEKFRQDRLEGIIISAMLQSQQCWMPVLHPPTDFEKVLELGFDQRFIAHCLPEQKQELSHQANHSSSNKMILIGPEGDFTPDEIEMALGKGFLPVALGSTRLRTETAGMVAATLLRLL